MVFSTRSGLFFFFLALLFSSQINARDSYSFGKFQREQPKDQNPNNLVPFKTNENDEQDDQKPTFIPESVSGYGLYGQEKAYNDNEELNTPKYEENTNYDDSFSTPNLSQTQESYKYDEENYPKTIESYDNYKDTRYQGNSVGYGTEKRYKQAYNVERQGMSDTRFMANGNYYYDLDDHRNHGRFYQKHYYGYKPTTYNEKDSSFNTQYNSMNEQPEMFREGHGDQFTP